MAILIHLLRPCTRLPWGYVGKFQLKPPELPITFDLELKVLEYGKSERNAPLCGNSGRSDHL